MNPSPVEIAAFLGSLAFAVTLANGLLKLSDRIRGKTPQPPNGELELSHTALEERVTKLENEQEAIRKEMKDDRDKILLSGSQRGAAIYQKIEDVRKEMKEDIVGVHERVNVVLEKVSELKGAHGS